MNFSYIASLKHGKHGSLQFVVVFVVVAVAVVVLVVILVGVVVALLLLIVCPSDWWVSISQLAIHGTPDEKPADVLQAFFTTLTANMPNQAKPKPA